MAIRKMILAASLLTVAASSAFAQDATNTTVPGHPRVNQIDQRLNNQEKRVDSGVASGTINAKQEARDNKRDAKVSSELSADQAKNGGHVTKAEQRKIDRQLDKNSSDIKRQKEVDGSGTAAK